MGYLGPRSTKLVQPKLFDYGIQCEGSDLRAHVCPKVRLIYVYPTKCGIRALPNGIETLGYQPGVKGPTANGRRVKPFEIEGMVALKITDKAWDHFQFAEDEDTTSKGSKAVKLVAAMIRRGMFTFPGVNVLDQKPSKRLQIQGRDITVWLGKRCIKIQVKCDFNGGEKTLGGSGYLYLQIAERNPLKRV